MHELSVVQSIVNTTIDFTQENHIDNVKYLKLVIGKHTGVIPKYVRMYYNDLCEGTILEGSQLKIEEIATEYFCRDCGYVFKPTTSEDHHHFNDIHCPDCHSNDIECISGDELMIKEIGYE